MENVAGRYVMDGKKVYAKAIYKEPEKYFTDEVLEQLDQIAKVEFSYGNGNIGTSGDDDSAESDLQ